MKLLSKLYQPIRFYSRVMIALASFMTSAAFGVISSVVCSIVGRKGMSQWTVARFFYTLGSKLLGNNVTVRKRTLVRELATDVDDCEPQVRYVDKITVESANFDPITQIPHPAVVISNHQNEMDIWILGRIMPQNCSITAKSSLKLVPILGLFMSLSGTVFLDRANRNKSLRVLNGAVDAIKNGIGYRNKREKVGHTVFMYPEGTRSYACNLELLPFKKGAFHLAIQAQVPIVPIVIANTSRAFNGKQRLMCKANVIAEVLDPIETTGLTAEDVNELVLKTYERMSAVYRDIGYAEVLDNTSTDIKDASADERAVLLNGQMLIN
ncbi:acyltransferase-domain-containing protein [Nadsonia fulvescens var. elongata DSM 6958]|uniref:1-acyl-sn-glycerol-3-phosphate acyltransferase n=1 Tax=Nadsonia fulvescens var. elongata DSM 6958 TaxID=857566 RepID=A0A1E3PCL3_9ASCO|nr:acyltransferase-domain-containing protein [Nadsonia fulvescens var. elongata DSM 6958]